MSKSIKNKVIKLTKSIKYKKVTALQALWIAPQQNGNSERAKASLSTSVTSV